MAEERDAGIALTREPPATDVVVIGGGPAGATVARLLAVAGRRVTLVARRRARVHHAESLPPSCVRLLARVGVGDAVAAAGFVRSSGNTVWWGSDESRVERFPADAVGYQVDRGEFDDLLLAVAARAGVDVTRDATALDVERAQDASTRIVRLFRERGGGVPLRCRWVLDCTGRAGMLARRDGRRRLEQAARTVALLGLWERRDARRSWRDDEAHTFVESYRDGWGWSVPASPTRRCIALMVDPGRTALASRADLAGIYDRELRRAPHLARLSEGAQLVATPWARDASPYFSLRAAEDGALLVGDAASFVDPLSSYGVKKALSSAWLAAVVVDTCLADDGMRRDALSLYEERERAMYETLRRRAAALARQAVGAHGDGFWDDAGRADGEAREVIDEPDVAALRRDADVLGAFEEIRRRPSLTLRPPPSLARVRRPTVRDNRVVLEERLAAPGFAGGIRYVRNIDLVTLVELAPAYDQVPDLYDAYRRAAPAYAPALPDFLGALSVLVGKGMLDLV